MIAGSDFKLRLAVSRNYGTVTVGFELEETFVGGGMQEYLRAVDDLNRALRAIAEHWERQNVAAAASLPASQQPPSQYGARQPAAQQAVSQPAPQPASQQVDTQQGPLTLDLTGEVVHIFDGTSHKWRFKGGKWTQWGVAIYPEHLPGFFSDSSPLGTQPGQYSATVWVDNGKPVRATNVTPVALGF